MLCPFSTPCQIITPLIEIAIWLPNPNPSPTPNPKPTNTRGVIIWQGSELGTTPVLPREHEVLLSQRARTPLSLSLSLSVRLLCSARGGEERHFQLNTDIMLLL